MGFLLIEGREFPALLSSNQFLATGISLFKLMHSNQLKQGEFTLTTSRKETQIEIGFTHQTIT